MAMPLVTVDERAQLLTHGAALAAGQGLDVSPVVRLFTPDAHATWLLVSLDPVDGDTAYGLIDLGIGMPALGKVKRGVRPAGTRKRFDHRLMEASAAWRAGAIMTISVLPKTYSV